MARSIATSATSSNRNRGVLMLAALFAILSFALMFAFLKSRDGDGGIDQALNSGAGAETVVVLTRNVAVGEEITSDMLTTKTLPGGALVAGRVTDNQAVVGKVATAPLFVGEQILSSKVTTFEGQTTLAYKVPKGLRALSLMVPHEAWVAAGLPQPGDRIDVLAITTLLKVDPLTGNERPDVVSGVIAQDIEVLAVAQSLVKYIPNLDAQKAATDAGATPAAGSTADAAAGGAVVDGDPKTYEKSISITLALTPELAAKVGLIDALEDDTAQYRILVRHKGEAGPITGKQTWSFDEIFTLTTK